MSEYLHRIVLNPYRDKQQDPPSFICENPKCQAELYSEDTIYRYEGRDLCGECIEDIMNSMTTYAKAMLLGADPVKVRDL